jgi:molybdopterin/thiamine biosynthesis adenylyltransferase
VDDPGAILSFLKERTQDNTITLAHEQDAMRIFQCPLRDIEEIALNHSILPARYIRNGLNGSDQLKLLQSRVAIIGCGGLGGRTAEILTRIGIGHLTLTDPDVFSESNLNRQIFCTVETLGSMKTEVLARELQKTNPALQVTKDANLFSEQSIASADIVVDGLDSVEARRNLLKLCQKHKRPLIHGAVTEWYGQVGVELSENALIATLYPLTAGVPKVPKVLPMTVTLIAATQAAEVCKMLLGYDSPLTRGWLQADLLHCDYQTLDNRTSRDSDAPE